MIVVTGSEGLIGRSLINHLINTDRDVIGIDILKNSSNKRINYFSMNLAKPDLNRIKLIEILNNNKITGWINTHYPTSEDWDKSPVSFSALSNVLCSHLGSYIYITQLVCENSISPISIINLGSIYGSISYDFNMYNDTNISQPVPYPAIKSGIIHASKMFAVKYANLKHRINCISPGGVYNNHSEVFLKNYSKNTPFNRMANVEELFSGFDYFLDSKSSYTTGQNLIIDGGYSLK